jgi:type IV secretion system protein VirB10
MMADNHSPNQPSEERRYPASPLFMDDTGKEKSKKTKRTSGQKILLFVASAAAIVIIFVFMAANSERVIGERQANETGQRKPIMSDPSMLQNDLLAAAEALKYRPTEQQPETSFPAPQGRIVVVRPPTERTTTHKIVTPAMLTDEEREAARKYRDMRANALTSRSKVEGFERVSEGSGGQRQDSFSSEQLLNALESSSAGPNGNAAALMQEGANAQDVNAYRHKLDFLTQNASERTPQGYSTNIRNAPLAPMELKAGSVIPGLLITGINSDLPGTVIGQVSENVWDTATGKFLLIPQGARILGVYDSRITQGQKRVSVVWNRLIYPDGSSLNIAGSPGTDIGGYSGIKGRVDNHYGQLLNAVLFSSVFTALADIAAGDTSNNDKKSAKDVLVETTGVTIANVGARLAERALDIQPTIVIKPGSRFNVMVQQDVVFLQPWRISAR